MNVLDIIKKCRTPRIRKARPRDVPAIIEMVDRTMAGDYRGIVPDDEIAKWVGALSMALKGPWPLALVADYKGLVSGVALVRDGMHLSLLWTAEGCRGAGLGTALMDAVEHKVFSVGHPYMTLSVYRDNDRAVTFYQHRGWTVNSQYVGEVGAVVLEMRKKRS